MQDIPHSQMLNVTFKEAIQQKRLMVEKYKWLAGTEKDKKTKKLWEEILLDHQRHLSNLQEKMQNLNLQ